MLYVTAPAVLEIQLFDIYDKPIFDGVYSVAGQPNFGQPRPQVQSYRDFLLARLADEVFFEHGGEKKGVDAIELIQLARRQIKTVCEPGAAFHGFENEVATRLQQAILHPKLGHISSLAFEHNWYDWVQLWKTLHKEPPAVLAMPEPIEGLVPEAAP